MRIGDEKEIDFQAGLSSPNKKNWKLGFDYMLRVAKSEIKASDPSLSKLIHQAQYNVGKSYFQGFGVNQSDELAEKWWLLASNNGEPDGSVLAMTSYI